MVDVEIIDSEEPPRNTTENTPVRKVRFSEPEATACDEKCTSDEPMMWIHSLVHISEEKWKCVGHKHQIRVWDDASFQQLIMEHYSWFGTILPYVSSSEMPLIKMFFLLLHYGGMYISSDDLTPCVGFPAHLNQAMYSGITFVAAGEYYEELFESCKFIPGFDMVICPDTNHVLWRHLIADYINQKHLQHVLDLRTASIDQIYQFLDTGPQTPSVWERVQFRTLSYRWYLRHKVVGYPLVHVVSRHTMLDTPTSKVATTKQDSRGYVERTKAFLETHIFHISIVLALLVLVTILILSASRPAAIEVQ